MSSYHVAKHHPVRSESLQPHTERSSRPGSEPPSVAADVYVWRYALLVVHARKEEDIGIGIREPDEGSNAPFIRGPVVVEERMRSSHWLGSVL